jgi:hypothetical protein
VKNSEPLDTDWTARLTALPTVVSPVSFDSTITHVMRTLANASIELAAIKEWKKL